jgi:putative ABC transport system permease protein
MSPLHDLRNALRTILRAPLVSTLAIVAFALGIGVTTAVFSIFYSVLLKPLPYPDADRLVSVYDTQPACRTCPASLPKFMDWKARNTVFSHIGGSMGQGYVLTGAGEPVRLAAVRTTASLANVFGVQPALGRWFNEEEDQPNGRKVVVLSHELWTTRFAQDPGILGRAITLSGEPYEVIGVMPATFSHRRAEAFTPLAMELDPARRGSHFLVTYARMKAGVTVEQAAGEMRRIGSELAREFGNNHGVDVRSYREVVVGDVRAQLRMLLAAVVAVLLIGSANVANLLLAAGLARRRELGIRLALGARPAHLARQLVAESTLLATIGGALGVLLAFWLLRTFVTLAANQLPRASTVAIDGRVLLFSAVVTAIVGILCGLWPLVRLRTRELADAVREGDMRTGSSRQVGNGLVVAEIALAFALLVGGALLVKNLLMLQARDAGIRADRVVTFDLAPSGPRYADTAAVRALYAEVTARLAAIGGVQHVGTVSDLPMWRFGNNGEMQIEGQAPWEANAAPLVEYRWYSGDYFKALGIPLVSGRLLDARDQGENAQTVLINRAMAEKFWPGDDAIGKRFGQGTDRSRWHEVVGIVGDIRSFGLAAATPYEFYQPLERGGSSVQSVVIRATSDTPESLIPAARAIVTAIDPALPLASVQTMEDVVAASVGQQRLISAMAGLFALLAALLAMVGVFGVMTYNVRRQRRELGIRLALGAESGAVRRLVVTRGLKLAAFGILIGAAGAWLLTGTLQTMLDDVQPKDPLVFGATAAAVVVAALLASWLPARSAGKTDPMIVLRDG